ncbi:hypothetical protein Syun_005900 [Stephania yunnanensis]|uniref:Uncharacterized protein n=1 Tax=Stephania yunnanensis TaxID=152371 RepID=A0AAP0KXA2_9MAGN
MSVTCIGDDFYRCTKQPFPSLRILEIIQLSDLEEWNEALPLPPISTSSQCSFPLLEELTILGCPRLKNMPTLFPNLRNLIIHDCNSTVVMMLGITSKFTSLISLKFQEFQTLTQIPPRLLSNNKLLQCLEIRECPMLQLFPTEELEGLTALQELTVGGFSETLDCFPYLSPLADEEKGGANQELHIDNFPNIVNLPDWLGNLHLLQDLELFNCPKLIHLPSLEAFRQLTALHKLDIYACLELGERCANDQGEESTNYLMFRGSPSIMKSTSFKDTA